MSSVDRQRVLILGSTGSIGTQALEVIAANPERFEVVGPPPAGKPGLLARQRAETGVSNVAVADPVAAERVGGVTHSGPEAVTRLVLDTAERTGVDVVLNALVGALGLQPTLAALATGARLALANKESLVAGGPLVLKAARPGPDRAGGFRSIRRWPSACGPVRQTRWPSWCSPPRVGRSRLVGRRPVVGDARAGRRPPDLEHGPDEHAELGVAGQQGLELIETHLLFGVPYERIEGGGAPAVGRALHGDLRRRLDHRPGQPAGYEAADLAGAGLAAPGRRFGRRLRFQHRVELGFRALDSAVFPAVDLARSPVRPADV